MKFAETIKRPFNLTYNNKTQKVEIDRQLATRKEISTPMGDKIF
jgi:hypothetical protein